MSKPNGSFGIRAAALFQMGSKYVSMGAQLVITAVLARLITPSDFGIVAIVTVIVGFFTLFSDMGISAAIVQYRDLTEEDCGGIFGFSVVLAAGLTILFCLVSPFVAAFYADERLIPLCLAVSPTLFFSTVNMVPGGLILKDKRFDRIAVRLVAATAISGTVAIVAALAGAGVIALILQSVMSSFIVLVWNLVSRPVRKISFHFAAPLKRVFSYSAFNFAFNFINYFSRNLDNLLIGKFLGSDQLGYYDKAYKLTTYPMNALSSVIGSVIQPYMAEHQDEPDVIFNCFIKVEKTLSLLAVPIAAIFFCCSGEIVDIVYGSNWSLSAPVFGVLAISVYFQMLGNPSGGFFQSLGRADYMFFQGLVNTALTICGLLVGLAGGTIFTVACGVGLAFCAHIVSIVYFLVVRSFKRSIKELIIFLPEIACGLVAGASCSWVFSLVSLPAVLGLACKSIFVLAVIAFGYWRSNQLHYIKDVVRR